jgi:drug/metabolite transporter (DMT)-like permease
MLTVALASLAALGYGVADFLAGLAARRSSVIRATLLVYVAGLVTIVVLLPLVHEGRPSLVPLAWGAVSGAGQAVGALALIAGFRRAPFSIAGPLSAVVGAGLAVIVGVFLGERPGGVAWVGLALALPTILAVSASAQSGGRGRPAPRAVAEPRGGRVGVGFGLAAGIGCAVSLIGLGRASTVAGVWPVLAVQVAALATLAAVASATGDLHPPAHGSRWLSAGSGILGCCSAIAFLLAAHHGLLAVAAVVTSLFPVVTVALAVVLAEEKLGVIRLVGLVLAAISVSLIALGSGG